jgi:hypothetical protein
VLRIGLVLLKTERERTTERERENYREREREGGREREVFITRRIEFKLKIQMVGGKNKMMAGAGV